MKLIVNSIVKPDSFGVISINNSNPFLMNLVPSDSCWKAFQNGTKIVKIGDILIPMQRQKLLCNAVVIVRPGHYLVIERLKKGCQFPRLYMYFLTSNGCDVRRIFEENNIVSSLTKP